MPEPAHPAGPHSRIAVSGLRDRFTLELFDRLWDDYRRRVDYVRRYEEVVAARGGTFVNDHIAFRTLAGQTPLTGIARLSRLFEALGYVPAGCYHFPDKHLNAIHYQHPHPDFPKLFISELKIWELSEEAGDILQRLLSTHCAPVSLQTLQLLFRLDTADEQNRAHLQEQLLPVFQQLPWEPPEKRDVETINRESQYAAWVMVHGYAVNHFTALVNSHGVDSLNDIEKTMQALREAGIPVKPDIEGAPGSKLRQSATQAVVTDVKVRDEGKPTTMPWTYAYFELAERNEVIDPVTGEKKRFEGFLGPQATQLFEMTRR